MNMVKITPTADHVVVEAVEEETVSASGIIIPDTATKEKPVKGKVLAVGPGKKDIEMTVKEGDIVLYSKYGPTEVKVDGKEVLILRMDDILAKLS